MRKRKPRTDSERAKRREWRRTDLGRIAKSIHRIRDADRNVEIVIAFKDRPCKDCGIRLPPEYMELDHEYGPPLKQGGRRVSRMKMTLAQLIADLEKCEVRCSICHRRRHRG